MTDDKKETIWQRNARWRKAVGQKIVVVINGVGGSGKDTFVNHMASITSCEIDSNKMPIVRNISTIDPIKKAAFNLGWSYGKSDRDRKFLSDLKRLSAEYNDLPYQFVKDIWEKGEFKILFVHCREPEEIERFVKDFGAITLLIKRPGIEVPNNESDMAVEDYGYDYMIYNGGEISDLMESARWFCREIGCGEFLDNNEDCMG